MQRLVSLLRWDDLHLIEVAAEAHYRRGLFMSSESMGVSLTAICGGKQRDHDIA